MLTATHRLRDSDTFRRAARQGRRAGSRTLVTHLLVPPLAVSAAPGTSRVGFVVGRAVGSAVVRNQVKRRLRHAVRSRIAALPQGSVLVVRARPAAAGASYDALVADLERCLERVLAGSAEMAARP